MSELHIVFGPQGAGKTTYAKALTTQVNGIHLSIDEWMWTLYGDDLPTSMNLKWILERVDRCEKKIWALAKEIASRNVDVILDLGFTKRAKRKLFLQLAEEHGAAVKMHYVTAEHAVRRRRVLERNVNKGETFSFEVTPAMFDFMEGEFNKATDSELSNATMIDTNPTP